MHAGVRFVVGILVAVLAAGGGCGLFGGTKAQTLQTPSPMTVPVALQTVHLQEGQSQLRNVGTFAIGQYNARDVEQLQATLQATLTAAAPTTTGPAYDIHVLVRRVVVAHSNNEGLAVACVTWALTDPTGGLVFHEQFYASDHVRLWGTIGALKNHVHEGITRHIITQAERVASGHTPGPVAGPFAHATYEAATSGFPATLTSVHVNALMFGGGYSLLMTRFDGDSPHAWVRTDDHVDWTARLAGS